MAHVRNVLDVEHVITEMPKVADDDIEGNGGLGMPDVRRVVDRGAADIHVHAVGDQRLKRLLLTGQGVVDLQRHDYPPRLIIAASRPKDGGDFYQDQATPSQGEREAARIPV